MSYIRATLQLFHLNLKRLTAGLLGEDGSLPFQAGLIDLDCIMSTPISKKAQSDYARNTSRLFIKVKFINDNWSCDGELKH